MLRCQASKKHRFLSGSGSSGDNAIGDVEERAVVTAAVILTPVAADRLVGLVVKASASRAEGPGFESRLRRDFFGVESYQ